MALTTSSNQVFDQFVNMHPTVLELITIIIITRMTLTIVATIDHHNNITTTSYVVIIISRIILVYYCNCCNLIGYSTCYLFVDRQ